MRKDAETRGAKRSRSRGTEGQKRKKTRGHGDARTRGAAGHTDLRTEISRVGGDLEPRVLVSASSPLRVSPEGTLRTWAPGHLCTDTSAPGHLAPLHRTPPHSSPLTFRSPRHPFSASAASGAKGLMPRQAA